MKSTLHDRLLRRDLGVRSPYTNVRGIYGDKKWVKDLDIVNELTGHAGCVNALSWSKSGMFLASGSDDQHINIHTYQPESSASPFSLTTTVATGHTANIFSVKFMPHSNDRTLVTAAGDAEVRIFDIEHQSRGDQREVGRSGSSAPRGVGYLNNGVQYLREGDTSAKVYRSHGDRVKRIVTESSPYLFLSCSEDGEVRQWDLRQPSSAYPRPFERGSFSLRPRSDGEEGATPPPLISYKKWHLDLHTISCSPSQPHYIALGGAHLHCFLHDRRMIGRDRALERGSPGVSSGSPSDHDDDTMGEATRCVKRFAPNGQKRMKRTDNGHITACKISDANPNELIVSWSGEWIYSFDLLRSPDARDSPHERLSTGERSRRAKRSADRKRKRTARGTSASLEGLNRAGSKARRSPPHEVDRDESGQMALRVRYENGQSENIPLRQAPEHDPGLQEAAEAEMTESQKASYRIANISVKIRKHMFNIGRGREPREDDPTGHASDFTSVLGFSTSILDDMDEIIRSWRYPVDPDDVDVVFQKTLKQNRESARRFVQASGTISRLLGGKLRTGGSSQNELLSKFSTIVPAPNESGIVDPAEQFCYDFLKAICLWLDSGVGALVDGFSAGKDRRNHSRFPLPENASVDDVDDILIPYLLGLASDRAVMRVDSSPFEVDQNRKAFESEQAAVLSFAQAVKIPFEDLSRAVVYNDDVGSDATVEERVRSQDRRSSLKFWGYVVARGVLLNAGEGVNHAFIDRAFGGLGRPSAQIRREERAISRQLTDIDAEEDELEVESVGIVRASTGGDEGTEQSTSSYNRARTSTAERDIRPTVEIEDENSDEEMLPIEDVRDAVAQARRAELEGLPVQEIEERDDDDADSSGDDVSESEDEDDDYDEDGDTDGHHARQFVFRQAFEKSSMREKVRANVPCVTHERNYRGHCNVKTVKDVNFYGLNDEYVVSGSDSGHVFIWDRHTSRLLNILEGDGEVVNVIQGHPYEPMLAVSGIDHTVKIFSPDARSRRDARNGIGVTAADSSSFSSLRLGSMRRRPARRATPSTATPGGGAETTSNTSESAMPDDSDDDDAPPPAGSNGLASRKKMHLEYQITSQNDVDRRGGNREAFITRSMLAQLAARIHLQRPTPSGGNGDEDVDVEAVAGEDDEGNPILLDDNCSVQ